MAAKPKKIVRDITSEIPLKELVDKNNMLRLNPFKVQGLTYRIVGTRINSDGSFSNSVLCINTRKYAWWNDDKLRIKVLMAKNQRLPEAAASKIIASTRNETIEEHRANFPNQSNIFDVVPDVKIEKKQTQAKR